MIEVESNNNRWRIVRIDQSVGKIFIVDGQLGHVLLPKYHPFAHAPGTIGSTFPYGLSMFFYLVIKIGNVTGDLMCIYARDVDRFPLRCYGLLVPNPKPRRLYLADLAVAAPRQRDCGSAQNQSRIRRRAAPAHFRRTAMFPAGQRRLPRGLPNAAVVRRVSRVTSSGWCRLFRRSLRSANTPRESPMRPRGFVRCPRPHLRRIKLELDVFYRLSCRMMALRNAEPLQVCYGAFAEERRKVFVVTPARSNSRSISAPIPARGARSAPPSRT